MTPEALAAEGPRCARHTEAAAAGTCVRCGSFACEACVGEREPQLLCAACVVLRDEALLGQPYSFSGSLARGCQLFVGALGPIAAISVLFSVPETIVASTAPLTQYTIFGSYLGGTYILGLLLTATFGIVADNAVYLVMIDVANARKPRLSSAIARGFRLWPRAFAVNFEVGLRVGLMSLLLVVPGVVESVNLAVAVPAAIEEPTLGAISRSRELTLGHRWSLFGLVMALTGGALVASMALSMSLGSVLRLVGGMTPGFILVGTLIARGLRVLLSGLPPAGKLAAYYGLRRSRQLLDSPS